MSDAPYYAACRGLTPPTDEMCERFAWHMAGRHSWHKHLPLFPMLPFTFFVGPMAHLHSDWGSRLTHIPIRTPEAHTEAFGCLDCLAPYDCYAGLDEEVHREALREDRAIWVRAVDGSTIDLPPEVLEAGTVLVNCFVHRRANRMLSVWREGSYRAREYLAQLGVDPGPTELDLGEALRSLFTDERLEAERARMLAEMLAAMKRVRALIWPDHA